MVNNRKRFISKLLVFILIYVPNYGLQVNAQSFVNNPPIICPVKTNGKKILFDNTHAQTAGSADWVIDGAFSDYAQGLAKEGYYVKELRKNTPITYEDLSEYDTFVIPEANIPFKKSEQNAILKYVKNGGSIFFIADHYNADRNKNRWDASEVFNGYRRGAYVDFTFGMSEEEKNSNVMKDVQSSDWLAENFGVRFRYNAIGDLKTNNIVSSKESFGITENVKSVAMHAGSTIAILNPYVAKGIVYLPQGLSEHNKWKFSVDKGVYNSGGVEEGAYVAIAKKGLGKAAFIGDSSPVEDSTPKYLKEENGQKKKTYDGYLEGDDSKILIKLINWLSNKEDYTDFTQVKISLDKTTVLHHFEEPSLSKEPKLEPWAKPTSNYKWYDSKTFAKGSYGYSNDGEDHNNSISHKYSFKKPNEIIANKELLLTINFTNMAPNSTLNNIRVGAYEEGGNQVGKFRDNYSVWPSNYGYSKPFSIKTDAKGNASKILVFKIKEGVSGSFYLRMKQNKNKLLTEQLEMYRKLNRKLKTLRLFSDFTTCKYYLCNLY